METTISGDIAHEWRVNRLLAVFYDQKKKRKTCAGCVWANGCDCTLPFNGAHKIVPSLTTRCVHYEEADHAEK